MPFWAVGQTAAGRESFAAQRVAAELGLEVFVPQARLAARGQAPAKICAVFPRYFFVRVQSGWRDIKNTIGVIGLIMAGETPARCPDSEIERLLAARSRDGLFKLPSEKPGLAARHGFIRKGTIVRITIGPFRGFDALYLGQSARERERVLLDLLGRRVPIELAADEIIVAEHAKLR